MDIYEAMQKRMTIRDFSDKPVDESVIEKIINAGFLAPTNNHMRDWHFILLNDREKRAKIIEQTMKQVSPKAAQGIVNRWGLTDPSQRDMYYDAIPKQVSMLLTSACLLLPCFRQEANMLKPKSLSDLNGFASIWLCIENLLLAAAAEGVFGVTRIPFDDERVQLKNFLNIPAGYEIPCWIALGYPADNARRASQVQINVKDRIHRDSW
ncbi:MAG: nitroreductase family protein [Chloroflexi bacterium]|nr:nitroreductase family protein [Chloroflexota bacterium]BCY19226.1 nitroreductase [Leptolinea sp. HRD-7]